MFDLEATIIYTTIVCVSVATENTLELRGNVVYGQPFNLVCFSNKNTSYYSGIFFRNFNASHSGTKVASILYLNSCIVANNSLTDYTYGCSNEGKNITLTVPAENEVEHNTFWRCANQAFPNQENNNVIQVFINEPVRNVTIRNNTVVNVAEGISETFVCESSPCRPSADIYWMKNGINITDPQTNSSIYQSGTQNITLSYLRFTAVKGDNGSLLACSAFNGYGTGKFSANVTVIVHYSPAVNNFTSPLKVIQGHPMEVLCSADGNPSPQLTWNPVGEDKVNKSRLYYSALFRDKAVVHTCTATTNIVSIPGSPQTLSDSKQLLIDVLYSPTVNNFTSSIKVLQGQSLELVCSADGNPPPKLTWNPAGEDKVNKSRLYYSAISGDKSVIHTCTATNNMVPTTGSPQSGSDLKELLIDVLNLPIVNPFTSPIKVIEGHSLEVLCSADGNPSPKLTWNPVGEDKVNKSRLYYSAISRDKAVIHTCTARNYMVPTIGRQQPGSDSKELFIDVLYNASISRFTSKDNISVVNENGSLQLQCQVDSNPNSVISIYLENDLKLQVENALSLSYTKTAACLDAGEYKCTARNKIINGDAVTGCIQINVTCYPRLDHRRNISTDHYGTPGENVTLEVYVIAFPEPRNIVWYHREKEADTWQMLPYQSPLSSGLYSSITVHLATKRDFGYYLVNMSNDFGIYKEMYHIIPETATSFGAGVEVAAIAGGISAGLVVILVVGMSIFFWRRYKKQIEHNKDTNTENEERSPEDDSYENLHPYANSDSQMYSSLKISETSKDSQKHYENTWIKA